MGYPRNRAVDHILTDPEELNPMFSHNHSMNMLIEVYIV